MEDVIYCPICEERAYEYVIECSKCKQWFHYKCVGMKRVEFDNQEDEISWSCGFCLIKRDPLKYRADRLFIRALGC